MSQSYLSSGLQLASGSGSNHKMSVMGWAGHDERKRSDGRVAEEMALKSSSVAQNKGRLLMKHSSTLM